MGTKPSSEAFPYAAFPDPLRSPVGRGRVAVVGEGFKKLKKNLKGGEGNDSLFPIPI